MCKMGKIHEFQDITALIFNFFQQTSIKAEYKLYLKLIKKKLKEQKSEYNSSLVDRNLI